jgi:hypothetical protein
MGNAAGAAHRIEEGACRHNPQIAVILRCIWTDGTEFWWTKETATACCSRK